MLYCPKKWHRLDVCQGWDRGVGSCQRCTDKGSATDLHPSPSISRSNTLPTLPNPLDAAPSWQPPHRYKCSSWTSISQLASSWYEYNPSSTSLAEYLWTNSLSPCTSAHSFKESSPTLPRCTSLLSGFGRWAGGRWGSPSDLPVDEKSACTSPRALHWCWGSGKGRVVKGRWMRCRVECWGIVPSRWYPIFSGLADIGWSASRWRRWWCRWVLQWCQYRGTSWEGSWI